MIDLDEAPDGVGPSGATALPAAVAPVASAPQSGPAGSGSADDDEVLAAVAELWRAVARDEEARFSGLNARALGVLTVCGLVVSIGALFAKDLLTEASLSEAGRWVVGTALAVALLVLRDLHRSSRRRRRVQSLATASS